MQRVDGYRDLGRYNARLFGVANDGVTDVTTAVHALRDLAGVGAQIYFPTGDYLVGPLTANVANQHWVIEPGATFTLKAASNNQLLNISAAGVTIEGGLWDQNTANQTGSFKGILVNADDVTLDHVRLTNSGSYGIWIFNKNRARLRHCTVTDTLSTGIFAQLTASGTGDRNDLVIESCHVDRSSISAASVAGAGISVQGYSTAPYEQIGASIMNNTVRMPTNPTSAGAICIETFGLAPSSRVIGNSCFGGSMGVSADRSDESVIQGNIIFGPKSYGIELASSQFCTVAGNTVNGNALLPNGISVNNASNGYNAITGNVVMGLAASGRGIKVTNSPFTTISGNVVKLVATGYAVELISSDDCAISGNALDGQSTANKAVMLDTVSGISVTGNRMKDFTEHGVLIFANGGEALNTITVFGNAVTNLNSVVATSLSGGSTIGVEVRAMGNAGHTRNSRSTDVLNLNADLRELWGTGDPESVVTAGVGSIYHRTDGGSATCLYIKESGTSNTGWVAK